MTSGLRGRPNGRRGCSSCGNRRESRSSPGGSGPAKWGQQLQRRRRRQGEGRQAEVRGLYLVVSWGWRVGVELLLANRGGARALASSDSRCFVPRVRRSWLRGICFWATRPLAPLLDRLFGDGFTREAGDAGTLRQGGSALCIGSGELLGAGGEGCGVGWGVI